MSRQRASIEPLSTSIALAAPPAELACAWPGCAGVSGRASPISTSCDADTSSSAIAAR